MTIKPSQPYPINKLDNYLYSLHLLSIDQIAIKKHY